MLMYMPAHICKCLCVNVLTCALVCVHVYSMLLCVPDHMCAYSYVCDAHVCILMSIWIHAGIFMCLYVCTYSCVHILMCIYLCMLMCVYMYVDAHACRYSCMCLCVLFCVCVLEDTLALNWLDHLPRPLFRGYTSGPTLAIGAVPVPWLDPSTKSPPLHMISRIFPWQ